MKRIHPQISLLGSDAESVISPRLWRRSQRPPSVDICFATSRCIVLSRSVELSSDALHLLQVYNAEGYVHLQMPHLPYRYFGGPCLQVRYIKLKFWVDTRFI